MEHLVPHFADTLMNLDSKKDYEVVNAACFFCDVLEFGGPQLFSFVAAKANEKFIEIIKKFENDRDLIQTAGYGLGILA